METFARRFSPQAHTQGLMNLYDSLTSKLPEDGKLHDMTNRFRPTLEKSAPILGYSLATVGIVACLWSLYSWERSGKNSKKIY